MGNFNFNNIAVNNNVRIADMDAATSFVFKGANNPENNGLCIRVRDSKAGKARFVNVGTGKMLTAGDGDYGTVVTDDDYADDNMILIEDMDFGTVFSFISDTNSDNDGIYIRVRDSKAGKGRFVNLETGKLLTSSGDYGTPVDPAELY